MLHPRAKTLLRLAGVITWILTGIPALYYILSGTSLTSLELGIWGALFGLYGATFWSTSALLTSPRVTRRAFVTLGLQTLCVLGMFAIVCSGLEAMLLVIVAAQVGLMLKPRIGLIWVLAQTLLMLGAATFHWPDPDALLFVAGSLSVELLAFLTAVMAASEGRTRQELARTNAELRATQELLRESTRVAERVRISRELHDLIGHHLTALSLNLEAATHAAGEPQREALVQANEITRKLLGDVRDVVGSLRESDGVDLVGAVRTLVDGIPAPTIHLELPDDLLVADAERAHALLRCVQEIITNTIRHAQAGNLWITFSNTDDGVQVHARDDGTGAEPLRVGNGLRGMRERLEELGGRLDITSRAHQGGFHVAAWIPL